MTRGIGLSVGATALRAVAIGRSAVLRSPVLTLYPHRPAEVGVPSENANLTERGLIITDFVDRVGDPVAIVAADGTSHSAEDLLADALLSLLHVVTGGGPPAEPVGVTYPAHWRPAAVDALRRALAARPDLEPAVLESDAVASLTALQDDPGVPTRGVVALCDVGGSGASITLADAGSGFTPVGPTVRHAELSGDLIDQALLTRVVGGLAPADSVDLSGTSAIGSLSRLRGQCRAAKERLSTSAVTSLAVELPGQRTEVRITRNELDDAIRAPLDGFVAVLQDTLQRSGIRPNDLVAVASVGGGARIPLLTTTLSEHLRVPVITSAQPELAAAIGGGLTAARGVVPDGATAMAPAAAVIAAPLVADAAAPGSSTFRALAWSDADDLPEPLPADPNDEPYEAYDPRPQLAFTEGEGREDESAPVVPWYRRPAGIVAIAVLVALAAIAAAAWYVLRGEESPAPESTPTSVTTTAPPASDVPQSSAEPAPPSQAPGDQTVTPQAPPPGGTVTQPPPGTEAPPPSTEAPPPPTTEPPPPPSAPTTATTAAPSTQAPIIPTLPYQTIPGLPFVPAPIQPAP